jgi:hypothetical protein
LVLNVHKSRVENAKGFAENNWPALGSTAFAAQPSGEKIIILEEVPSSGIQHQHQGQNSKENSNMTSPNQAPNAGGPSSETEQENDQDQDTDTGSKGS